MESVSAPLVREEFESWVYAPMDSWPTPEDYATIVREGPPWLQILFKLRPRASSGLAELQSSDPTRISTEDAQRVCHGWCRLHALPHSGRTLLLLTGPFLQGCRE